MGVQLIIDGAHITDVISQVQILAEATDNTKTVVTKTSFNPPKPNSAVNHTVDDENGEFNTAPVGNLSTKEQQAAVKEMIENAQRDDRYDRLNNTNQKRVDAALAKIEPEQTELEDAIEAVKGQVTLDVIRERMSDLGKDENGDVDRERLNATYDVLKNFIPDGTDIKISNIPEEKMVEFYNKICELG